MKIVKFEDRYRDDLIFMILEAKDALGRVPRLNEDLLDIKSNYFDKGDGFWVAVDDNDRVVGCVGTKTVSEEEMWLKRLYVKARLKRMGIGTQLLKIAEEFAVRNGIANIYTRFAEDYKEAQQFYPKNGFIEIAPYEMVKHLK